MPTQMKIITDLRNYYPTLQLHHTGGGCTALHMPLANNQYLLITVAQDAVAPDDTTEEVDVGVYDDATAELGSQSPNWWECLSIYDLPQCLEHLTTAANFTRTRTDTEKSLIDELAAWQDANGIERQSADDMCSHVTLTAAQEEWIHNYLTRWDAMIDASCPDGRDEVASEVTGGSVLEYFEEVFGEESCIDRSLNELSIDTPCGADCVRAIDAGTELIQHVGDSMDTDSADGSMYREQIAGMVNRICAIYWRG